MERKIKKICSIFPPLLTIYTMYIVYQSCEISAEKAQKALFFSSILIAINYLLRSFFKNWKWKAVSYSTHTGYIFCLIITLCLASAPHINLVLLSSSLYLFFIYFLKYHTKTDIIFTLGILSFCTILLSQSPINSGTYIIFLILISSFYSILPQKL